MGGLSPAHLILILVVALLVIGPGKLPETGAAVGRAMREFRRAVDGASDLTETASTPAVATSAAGSGESAAAAPGSAAASAESTTSDPGGAPV
ncbi:MAG TPA: twin-arginine translocase TatA/TatE family subunit [Candidatus Limnocylindrales bacterium]|nr:twin-arginine translocase TatA/TatE family subunit [Candidatus Limnocylindrales bacterium]